MFLAAQIAVAVAASAVVVKHVRVLFFVAPLEAVPFLRALQRCLDVGDLRGARALAEAGGPGWIAHAAAASLAAWPDPGAVGQRLEEVLADRRDDARAATRPLRAVASLSSCLGMLFAILSLNGVGGASGGLLALEAGLEQSLAVGRAVACVATGGATSLIVLAATGALRRQSRRLLEDLSRLSSALSVHVSGLSSYPPVIARAQSASQSSG